MFAVWLSLALVSWALVCVLSLLFILYSFVVDSVWMSSPLIDDRTSFSHPVQMLAVSLL